VTAEPAEVLRRALLTVTLAELCQLDAAAVYSPTCPHCDHGPGMALPGGQAFCGNEDCDVLLWRITDRPDQFDAKARHLEATEDDRGGITWRPAAGDADEWAGEWDRDTSPGDPLGGPM
jgi:hypothetical protein